jgi:hypothetical protein
MHLFGAVGSTNRDIVHPLDIGSTPIVLRSSDVAGYGPGCPIMSYITIKVFPPPGEILQPTYFAEIFYLLEKV